MAKCFQCLPPSTWLRQTNKKLFSRYIRIVHLEYFLFLNTGGAILVLEKVLNENKDGPLMTLIFDLGMLISADGRERTALEYKRLLEKHGFIDVQIKILPDARFRDAILARKPTSGHYDLEK